MTGTPPGWYPDAQGTMRWFDGTNWTEHTQDAVPPAPPAAPPSAPPTTPLPTSPYGAPAETPAWTPMPPSAPQPGQPGQPGQPYGNPYGQGYAGAPQPPQKKSTGLVVGLGILGLLLVAGIVTVVVLLAGGSDSTDTNTAGDPIEATSSPTTDASTATAPVAPSTSDAPVAPATTSVAPTDDSTPEGVTEGFFKAVFAGDCDKLSQYVAGGSMFSGSSGCDALGLPSGAADQLKLKVGKATITGDTATVPVKLLPDIPGVDSSGIDVPALTATLSNSTGTWLITGVA